MAGDTNTSIEVWLRRELRNCATQLRTLAYSLPNGVGEHDFLKLSEQMNLIADQDLAGTSAPQGPFTVAPALPRSAAQPDAPAS